MTDKGRVVALYAHVSTGDCRKNPETQLLTLREWASAKGYSLAGEYVDMAGAQDLSRRSVEQRLESDIFHGRVGVRLDYTPQPAAPTSC